MNIANGDHHIGQRPLALGLTLSGILLRLIPHLPNFAPVGGVSLFAGPVYRDGRPIAFRSW